MSDLLDLAKRLESDLEALYRTLAGMFPEKSELLLTFADEEEGHTDLVLELLESPFKPEGGSSGLASASEAVGEFERSGFLLDESAVAERLRAVRDVSGALRLSAELERRIELFYCHVAPALDADARSKMYDLVLAEHRHRLQVEEMEELSGGGGR